MHYNNITSFSHLISPFVMSWGHLENWKSTGRLPEINTSLALSYMGDGFTTKRNLTDFQLS